MSQPNQTLDSALAAIAAEREALKLGQTGALAQVPSSAVASPMPLPPIPRAPGLVNTLPTHLQSVTRLDTPAIQNVGSVAVKKTKSKVMMVLGNAALSAVIGSTSFLGVSMLQGGMSDNSPLALIKSDLGAAPKTVNKQDKISAVQSAALNKSCTSLYQDLMTGHTKSSTCLGHGRGAVASSTMEVTQFSSESTSATVNSKKFIESLSTSRNKITESLGEAKKEKALILSLGNQFSQGFPTSQDVNNSAEAAGLDDEEVEFKLKPRGIVKKFYAPKN